MAKRGRKPKIQDTPEENQISVQEFLDACKPFNVTESNGIIELSNPNIMQHIRLHQYGKDLFNCIFAKVVINKGENLIQFWVRHPIKTKVEEEDGGYHYKITWSDPDYTVKGMLCPEKKDNINDSEIKDMKGIRHEANI